MEGAEITSQEFATIVDANMDEETSSSAAETLDVETVEPCDTGTSLLLEGNSVHDKPTSPDTIGYCGSCIEGTDPDSASQTQKLKPDQQPVDTAPAATQAPETALAETQTTYVSDQTEPTVGQVINNAETTTTEAAPSTVDVSVHVEMVEGTNANQAITRSAVDALVVETEQDMRADGPPSADQGEKYVTEDCATAYALSLLIETCVNAVIPGNSMSADTETSNRTATEILQVDQESSEVTRVGASSIETNLFESQLPAMNLFEDELVPALESVHLKHSAEAEPTALIVETNTDRRADVSVSVDGAENTSTEDNTGTYAISLLVDTVCVGAVIPDDNISADTDCTNITDVEALQVYQESSEIIDVKVSCAETNIPDSQSPEINLVANELVAASESIQHKHFVEAHLTAEPHACTVLENVQIVSEIINNALIQINPTQPTATPAELEESKAPLAFGEDGCRMCTTELLSDDILCDAILSTQSPSIQATTTKTPDIELYSMDAAIIDKPNEIFSTPPNTPLATHAPSNIPLGSSLLSESPDVESLLVDATLAESNTPLPGEKMKCEELSTNAEITEAAALEYSLVETIETGPSEVESKLGVLSHDEATQNETISAETKLPVPMPRETTPYESKPSAITYDGYTPVELLPPHSTLNEITAVVPVPDELAAVQLKCDEMAPVEKSSLHSSSNEITQVEPVRDESTEIEEKRDETTSVELLTVDVPPLQLTHDEIQSEMETVKLSRIEAVHSESLLLHKSSTESPPEESETTKCNDVVQLVDITQEEAVLHGVSPNEPLPSTESLYVEPMAMQSTPIESAPAELMSNESKSDELLPAESLTTESTPEKPTSIQIQSESNSIELPLFEVIPSQALTPAESTPNEHDIPELQDKPTKVELLSLETSLETRSEEVISQVATSGELLLVEETHTDQPKELSFMEKNPSEALPDEAALIVLTTEEVPHDESLADESSHDKSANTHSHVVSGTTESSMETPVLVCIVEHKRVQTVPCELKEVNDIPVEPIQLETATSNSVSGGSASTETHDDESSIRRLSID